MSASPSPSPSTTNVRPRRSSRDRRPAHTVYDDAVLTVIARQADNSSLSATASSPAAASSSSALSSKKRKKRVENDDDDDDESDHDEHDPADVAMEIVKDDSDDDDDHDDDSDDDHESSSDTTTSGDEESEAEPEPRQQQQQQQRKTRSSNGSGSGGKNSNSNSNTTTRPRPPKSAKVQRKAPKKNNSNNNRNNNNTSTAKNTRTNATTATAGSGSRNGGGGLGSGPGPAAPTRRAVQTALTALSKKVLDASETPTTSLVAALLTSYQDGSNKSRRGRGTANTNNNNNNKNTNNNNGGETTMYTAQLEKIAHSILREHGHDPNRAQVSLFNLLFRSVGGTVATNLDCAEIELEAVSEDEWMELITGIVKEMQTTPNDRILLCADPGGAAHAAAAAAAAAANKNNHTSKSPQASVGAREYRKIYEEFWYLLGKVALTGSVQQATQAKPVKDSDSENEEDSDNENDSDDKSTTAAPVDNARFQVELARDLVARLIEMVGVGQPDIRAAATAAVYQLGTAMLERTVELNAKLTVATRQLNVAKRAKMARKAEALKLQVDSWKRTVADLEEIVKDTILGVFMNRYRDSNMYIRANSLRALGTYTLIRPDMLFVGSYLKYFGWLLSDKESCVREQAVLGFLGPFREVAAAKGKREASPMDMSNAKSVIEKFLPRLADCAIDVDFQVQERAMELLLVLMREDFLESLDNDDIWEQINLQALARDTTPAVRRDALYFIIDQLEAFDSGPAKTEAKMVERIDGIAQWVGHCLADSEDIPIEHMKIELTDLVVSSLRAMPEHKSLVTSWPAMLRAIHGAGSKQSVGDKDERRKEAAKKRVLLRMLVCAAELEVNGAADDDNSALNNVDPDILAARKAAQPDAEQPKKKRKVESSKEEFTLALVKALPDLLISYKEETSVLQSLTTLPRYFLASVFNLPSRKNDFNAVLSNLSEVFLQSTDATVLQNCSFAITSLAKEEHARSGEALLQLKKIVRTLRDRLLELFEDKAAGHSGDDEEKDDSDDEKLSPTDIEHAICLAMRRLGILSKRWDLAVLLGEDGKKGSGDSEIDSLHKAVAEIIAKDLQARKVVIQEGEDERDGSPEIPKIWKSGSAQLHVMVAETLGQALSFLLSALAWRINRDVALIVQKESPVEDDTDGEEHVAVRMRNRLEKLVALCFDQYIEKDDDFDSYSEEHIDFANIVQMEAGRVAGDLRSLCPKAWSDAESPLLRSLALTEDGHLIGGFVRFLRSQEEKLRANENSEKESTPVVESLLLPLARGLTANWKLGNRREAGAGLGHITGSGQESSRLVSSMSKVLKKIEPVRLLEAHMACLRQDYEEWADEEPEELDSRPTEDEIAAHEVAEKSHKDKFASLEQQASRLSASLGVGKLSDKNLVPALLGFVREGVRFAFSTKEPGDEEDLPLGSRLSFLLILSKYLNWIRRDREHLDILRQDLDRKESELREDADFAEVYSDDLEALKSFRSVAGLNEFTETDDASTHYDLQESEMAGSATASLRRRMSGASSIRSKMSSTVASLSPLYEEDAGEEDRDHEDAQSPSQESQGASVGTNMSLSTLGRTQTTIDEGSEGHSSAEE